MRHYVLFPNVENARRLYDLLKAEGVKCTFAPTPREADKCCGVSVLFHEEADRPRIEHLIAETGIDILRYYEAEPPDPGRMKFC